MSHYSPIIAALVTMLLTFIILHSKFGQEIQDIPNERSLHSTPIPRIGGVALMAGLLSGWALVIYSLTWWLVIPMVALFILSLLDDMRGLPVRQRLLVHLGAAALLVAGSGVSTQAGLLGVLLIFLLTVWMTNLYNFMDGSDGLAGGMALFGFSFYGIAALMNQHEEFALLNFTVGAAALGFLFNNFPPAKVFMGDAGSIPLGFLAAAMGMWGWQQGAWAAWFPLLVFSPFVVDASVTLFKRSLRGAKVTEAHREHYYQRTIQSGWSHFQTALVEYALMLGCGVSALVYLQHSFPFSLFLAWLIVYALLILLIDARWQRFVAAKQ